MKKRDHIGRVFLSASERDVHRYANLYGNVDICVFNINFVK